MGEEVRRTGERGPAEPEEEEPEEKTAPDMEQKRHQQEEPRQEEPGQVDMEALGHERITAYIRKPYPEPVEKYMNTLQLKRRILWGVDKEDAETQMEVLCTLWQKEQRKAEEKYRRLREEGKQIKEKQTALDQRGKALEHRERKIKERKAQLLLREREWERGEKRKQSSLSWLDKLKSKRGR